MNIALFWRNCAHALRVAMMFVVLLACAAGASAQTLLNVDFGVGAASGKSGFAATGMSTNDFWNLYSTYGTRFVPGNELRPDGRLEHLKLWDQTESPVAIAVTNAPGVWGNASGDKMFDTYLFAMNGGSIFVRITGLPPGRYHFYLYGHADPDATAEQNSAFRLQMGTNSFGPLAASGAAGWKANLPWQENQQFVVFRDVAVTPGQPVVIEAAPGPGGVAVLNGLQIVSRGTAPPRVDAPAKSPLASAFTNLVFREVRYVGQLKDNEARFQVAVDVESLHTNEISGLLFEGEVAVIAPQLPAGVRLVTDGRQVSLFIAKPGNYHLNLELVARITREEPWNRIGFFGPSAAIATLNAQASGKDVQVQLLSGVRDDENAIRTGSVQGFLGADRSLSLRWQSKAAEVARQSLLTADTTITARFTPTAINYTTQIRFEILQAPAAQLFLAVPAGQNLTRLDGAQIRDWSVLDAKQAAQLSIKAPEGMRLLRVDFIKPMDKGYQLTLHTEQALESTPATLPLALPQPLGVSRESGALNLSADEMLVEIESVNGLRQVNAAEGIVAAYRFYGRPVSLVAAAKRIEPVILANDRVTARLEEGRLLVGHNLKLNVEKAGIYNLEFTPQKGFTVSDVRGPGVDDWKLVDGRLKVSFASRVLGARAVTVQLEQSLKEVPAQFTVAPLRLAGATRETAQVGVAAVAGFNLKTFDPDGLREIPVTSLAERADEVLAYTDLRADWNLGVSVERLESRIVAEVFNLVTIGDGLIGGSAVVRYGIINQGAQELKVSLPASWKNVEFTGPNIRRIEQAAGPDTNSVLWTISLQDKAWGGYTLVITYDHQFDPKGATLDLRGAHPLGVERETGTLAITTAAGLKLEPAAVQSPLRVMDPSELSENDRALITRPVLLAYRYTGNNFAHRLGVTRHAEVAVLDAVADRTEITTVLTAAGEMLTQASFMVKNNDRQFQRFELPADASLWACYVNGEPVKAEKDGAWTLVSLPRTANRDEAFAVDIVYAQKFAGLDAMFGRKIALAAPRTDVPNTYAEWEVFVPSDRHLGSFGGTMTIARGTEYGLGEAWQEFRSFYATLWHEAGVALIILFGLSLLIVALAAQLWRKSLSGLLQVVGATVVIALLFAMSLPRFANRTTAQNQEALLALTPSPTAMPAVAFAAPAAPVPPPPPEQMPAAPAMAQQMLRADQPQPAAITAGIAANGGTMVAGLRSIRIDLPKTGSAFHFTKVLNTGAEALQVEMSVMKQKVFETWRMLAQLAAFLAGIALVWREWIRARPAGFRFALGNALALSAVGGLLLSERLLHWAFILVVPLIVLLLFILLARLLWRGGRGSTPDEKLMPAGAPSGIPPAAAAIVFWFLLQTASSAATPVRVMLPPSAPTNSPAAVSLLAATYTGSVTGQVAQFEVAMQLVNTGTNVVVPLFNDDVALTQFSARGEGVRLMREGRSVAVLLAQPGEVSLQLKLAVRLGGDVTRRRLAFELPPALASRLDVLIDEEEADVEFPSAVSFDRIVSGNQTRVQAIVGPNGRVDLQWTPKVKRAAEVAATVFAENLTQLVFGGGVLDLHTRLTYQITQGEVAELSVRLPKGQKLLKVEGEGITTWQVVEAAEAGTKDDLLKVRLLKPVSGSYQLFVITEQVLDSLPASLPVATAQAMNVQRETGQLGVQAGDDLAVSIDTATGLERVDAREFLRAFGGKADVVPAGFISAFRFWRPEHALVVRAEIVQPQVEVVAHNHLRVGYEQVNLNTILDYTVKQAGVFGVKLIVPPGFRVESVTASGGTALVRNGVKAPAPGVPGATIQMWVEKQEDDRRLLDITFKERTLGRFQVAVSLVQITMQLPLTVNVPGVHPLEVNKLSGFVAVTSEAGVSVKSGAFSGLIEIPASALGHRVNPEGGSVLAYKFAMVEKAATQPWSLTVNNEGMESWVRAEAVTQYTVGETLITGRATVRYEIQNAPLKELRLKIPAAARNIELFGPDIRRRDQNGAEWRVELQNKQRGVLLLNVTWEEPKDAGTNRLGFTGVQTLGTERESGAVVILAKAPLQVVEQGISGELSRIDVREVPAWAGVSTTAEHGREAAALSYRYVRPGWNLTVDARRFDDAALLQALVESAQLTTVVADDGQMMTEMALQVRNNGRQFVEIALPKAATLWSAFVAGQPVRPTQRNDRLLLPLEQGGNADAAVAIELTFVHQEKFPRGKGDVKLASPLLDVPLKNAHWELWLPPDYEYDRFAGSMAHEAGAAPVARSYSLVEYNVKEAARRNERQVAAVSAVSNLKSQLVSGKFNNPNEYLNQARQNREVSDEKLGKDLEGLEQQVKRAQGNRLIEAQRAYSVDNYMRYSQAGQGGNNGQMFQLQNNGAPVDYDADIATRQWDMLCKAQELTTTRIQTLRVNLPTRGTRHSFAQVLQTEVNKPMTVEFKAANAKAVNWFERILAGTMAFLVLWAFCTRFLARRSPGMPMPQAA